MVNYDNTEEFEAFINGIAEDISIPLSYKYRIQSVTEAQKKIRNYKAWLKKKELSEPKPRYGRNIINIEKRGNINA